MKIKSHNGKSASYFDSSTGKIIRFVNGVADVADSLAHRMIATGLYSPVSTKSDPTSVIKFDPTTWTEDYKKVIFDMPISHNNGYGKTGFMMAKGLLNNNVDVKILHNHKTSNTIKGISKQIQDAFIKEDDEVNSFYITYNMGSAFRRKNIDRHIGYTMLEATHIPESYVTAINNECERVLVPSDQNKKAFIDSGVKCDVGVVPLGLDLDLFPLCERKRKDDTFIFGVMGGLTYRKGVDVLLRAFDAAFTKKDKVHLIVKSLPAHRLAAFQYYDLQGDYFTKHPQISLVYEDYDHDQLIENFFKQIDCFVFPTRGEGFGMPPIEAMATGLPVICTNWSGCEMYMKKNHSYPLDYKLVDMPKAPKGYPPELYDPRQKWAEPNFDHLVELMRYVYKNQDEAKDKGKKAYGYVKRHFSVENVSKKLIKYLDDKK